LPRIGNKFFLKATGLDQDAVQRLTIFSLVQPDKLANLFEMVAEALRQKPASESSTAATSSSCLTTSESAPSSTEAADTAPQPMEYAAMTLPCISFKPAPVASDASTKSDNTDPLFMTVSFGCAFFLLMPLYTQSLINTLAVSFVDDFDAG